MTRALTPPYRWTANDGRGPMTLSALRVIDGDSVTRIELYTPAMGGERLERAIDVPFQPAVLHTDCITVEDHAAEVARRVAEAATEADARAQAASEHADKLAEDLATTALGASMQAEADATRVQMLEAENEQLRRQLAATKPVTDLARAIDRLELLRPRPAYAHQIRIVVRAYDENKFPEYVTAAAHADALTQRDQEHAHEAAVVAKRFREVVERCARRLSDASIADPTFDVTAELQQIDAALET